MGLARSYGLRLIGPTCLGVINTDPAVGANASLSPLMRCRPPPGRAGFFCQSGALGSAILEKVNNRGAGLSRGRSWRGQPRRRSWATTCCSTRLRGTRPPPQEVVLLYLDWSRSATPEVLPGVARRSPRRKAGDRGALGPDHPGGPDGPLKYAGSGAAGRGGRDVPAGRRDPGRGDDALDEMFDVARLLAHQPLPPRSPGRRGGQLRRPPLATDAAASVGLVVNRQVALGADATAEDFEDASTGRSTATTSTPWSSAPASPKNVSR